MNDKNSSSLNKNTLSLSPGLIMLAIAAIVFAHLVYMVLNIPDSPLYILLIEFFPFCFCSITGITILLCRDQ